MNHRSIVVGLFVVAAAVLGTAGYDAVQSDRSVDVTVAPDQEAYLALDRPGEPIQNGTSGDILYVENRFETAVDVTLEEYTGDTESVPEQGLNRTTDIGPGERVALSATCATAGTYEVQVDLHAESVDQNVTVTVTDEPIEVECT
jgi:hypothetical protein